MPVILSLMVFVSSSSNLISPGVPVDACTAVTVTSGSAASVVSAMSVWNVFMFVVLVVMEGSMNSDCIMDTWIYRVPY